MQQRTHPSAPLESRRPGWRSCVSPILLVGIVALSLFAWPWAEDAPPLGVSAAVTGTATAAVTAAVGDPDAAPQRTDASAADDPPETPASLADYIDRLVAIGLETTRHHEAGAAAAARDSDARAKALFIELQQRIPDADSQALGMLCRAAGGDSERGELDRLRDRVLDLVLAQGLRQRHAALSAATDPAAAAPLVADLHALVSAMLTALPADDDLARRLGLGMLASAPYLDAPHEPLVLDLVALAGEDRFATDVATALLSTLWHNLQGAGRRSSDQLAGLCLLLLGDGNVSERLAAARLLLADARYRHVVLDHLHATRDRELARQVSMAAAQELPPAEAFAVVAAAASIDPEASAPFLMLGHRDAALVRGEYEQLLAGDREPRLRELLVAGAGFGGGAEGIEVARLALDSDTDPDVRLRAVFALTGKAAAALGERAITRALDDPVLGHEPQRLHALVHALENLARQGLIDAVDRLGRRLRATAGLGDAARADLDNLLARTLPGGAAVAR